MILVVPAQIIPTSVAIVPVAIIAIVTITIITIILTITTITVVPLGMTSEAEAAMEVGQGVIGNPTFDNRQLIKII
jgi:hypothetical protein